jgi:hypothetical protein
MPDSKLPFQNSEEGINIADDDDDEDDDDEDL